MGDRCEKRGKGERKINVFNLLHLVGARSRRVELREQLIELKCRTRPLAVSVFPEKACLVPRKRLTATSKLGSHCFATDFFAAFFFWSPLRQITELPSETRSMFSGERAVLEQELACWFKKPSWRYLQDIE